jgi:hypothetical protein
MSWRESLQQFILEGTYAKDAKAPLPTEDAYLLHLLHMNSQGMSSSGTVTTERPRILADSLESEPTKPSKPGSVGFDGATPVDSREIEAVPGPAELARASGVLHRAGLRLMRVDGVPTVGLWSDLDGPGVRAALHTYGSHELPVRYLDGAGIPMPYKFREVPGDPVPMNVLAEMERHPADPWKVRDRMLKEMGWSSKPIAWAGSKRSTGSFGSKP